MNKIEINDFDTEYLLKRCLLLLSLDRVRQFWDDMDLGFDHRDQVQDAFKHFIAEQQKLDFDNDPDYLKNFSGLLRELFGEIGKIEGEKGVEIIEAWIESFKRQQKYYSWISCWYAFFIKLDENQENVLVRLGIPEEKVEKIAEIARRYVIIAGCYLDKEEAADNEAFTEWDKQQYEIYQREGDNITPLDHLTLKNKSFFEIWLEITSLLTDEEMEILNQWGQIMAVIRQRSLKIAEIPPEFRKSTMKK